MDCRLIRLRTRTQLYADNVVGTVPHHWLDTQATVHCHICIARLLSTPLFDTVGYDLNETTANVAKNCRLSYSRRLEMSARHDRHARSQTRTSFPDLQHMPWRTAHVVRFCSHVRAPRTGLWAGCIVESVPMVTFCPKACLGLVRIAVRRGMYLRCRLIKRPKQ